MIRHDISKIRFHFMIWIYIYIYMMYMIPKTISSTPNNCALSTWNRLLQLRCTPSNGTWATLAILRKSQNVGGPTMPTLNTWIWAPGRGMGKGRHRLRQSMSRRQSTRPLVKRDIVEPVSSNPASHGLNWSWPCMVYV